MYMYRAIISYMGEMGFFSVIIEAENFKTLYRAVRREYRTESVSAVIFKSGDRIIGTIDNRGFHRP